MLGHRAALAAGHRAPLASAPRPRRAVVDNHRLANGLLFGLPVVLDTERDDITLGDRVLLTYNGEVGAALLLCSALGNTSCQAAGAGWRGGCCPAGALQPAQPEGCTIRAGASGWALALTWCPRAAACRPPAEAGGVHRGEQVEAQQAAGGQELLWHHLHRAPRGAGAAAPGAARAVLCCASLLLLECAPPGMPLQSAGCSCRSACQLVPAAAHKTNESCSCPPTEPPLPPARR